jgi:hypothetical protein
MKTALELPVWLGNEEYYKKDREVLRLLYRS